MNKYKYLLENVLVFGLGNIASKVLSFLLLALFTDYLTTKEFGDAELVITTISLLIPCFTLCISDAVLRFFFSEKKQNSVAQIGLVITLFGFILIALLSPLCLLYDPLKNYILYLLAIFFFNSFEQLAFNINKGLENVKLCAMNSIVSVISLSICSYFLIVLRGEGLCGYLTAITISHGVCTIYLFLGGNLHRLFDFSIFDKKLLKDMLYYSIPFVPSTIAWWVNSLSDRYLIVFYLGSAINGIYSAAAKIPNILSIFTTIFFQAWQLSGIKEYNSTEYSDFYSKIYNLYFIIMVCFCSTLICVVPSIGDFLFKREFYSAYLFVPFLVMGVLFSGLSGVLSSAYLAAKKTSTLMVSTVLGSLLNIVINICFLNKFGLQVASVSTFFSFVLVWFVRLYLIKPYVNIRIKWFLFVINTLLLSCESISLILNENSNTITYVTCSAILICNVFYTRKDIRLVVAKICR